MASNNVSAVSAFIEGAPPGEVYPPQTKHPPIHMPHKTPYLTYSPPASRRRKRYAPSPHSIYNRHHIPHTLQDIKALTEDDPALVERARPAFQKYSEEQLTTVKLPGSGKNVRTAAPLFLSLSLSLSFSILSYPILFLFLCLDYEGNQRTNKEIKAES